MDRQAGKAEHGARVLTDVNKRLSCKGKRRSVRSQLLRSSAKIGLLLGHRSQAFEIYERRSLDIADHDEGDSFVEPSLDAPNFVRRYSAKLSGIRNRRGPPI